MGPFVHLTVLRMNPEATEALIVRVRTMLETLPVVQPRGHLGATILVTDDASRMAVVTEWRDRHDWAHAQWDQKIQETVVDIFKTAEHVETLSYTEVFRYELPREG